MKTNKKILKSLNQNNNLIEMAGKFLITPPNPSHIEINVKEYEKLQKIKRLLNNQNLKTKIYTSPTDYSGAIGVSFYVLDISNREIRKLSSILNDDDRLSIDCDLSGKVHLEIVLPNYFKMQL